VPSLDDVDDETPLPPPAPGRDSDSDILRGRAKTGDEQAAMTALAGLSDLEEPVQAISSAATQATQAADKLEQAVRRVEAAAEVAARRSGEMERLSRASGSQPALPASAQASTPTPIPTQARAVARPPVVDIPDVDPAPPPRLKSRALGVISLLVVIAGAVGFYFVYQNQEAERAAAAERDKQRKADAEARSKELSDAQADRGTIRVTSTPSEASIWLKLGRTPVDTLPLAASQRHRLRIERDGYQPIDTEVVGASWEASGSNASGSNANDKHAKVSAVLKAAPIDKKTKKPQIDPLPALPPNLSEEASTVSGEGPLHVETTPPGAEVWLLIGFANTGVNFPTVAGRQYELRALADGYKPGFAEISVDEWRDPKGDPRAPIDVAKKKDAIDKHIDLEVDPDAPPPGAKSGSAGKPPAKGK
jgi:hypothetical protein